MKHERSKSPTVKWVAAHSCSNCTGLPAALPYALQLQVGLKPYMRRHNA